MAITFYMMRLTNPAIGGDADAGTTQGRGAERAAMEQLQAQLQSIFKNLPHEVHLILFSQPGKNDLFSAACRFLVRAVRESDP